MPGRGRPWRGVGEGNPDRIGTGAIADGSITEADLDSSVTSKLNSAGGHVIKDEGGSALPQRANLDFVGAGVTASDGIEDTTTVTIAGGGGGVSLENLYDRTKFWYLDEFFYGEDPDTGLPDVYEIVGSNTSFLNSTGNTNVGGDIRFDSDAVTDAVCGIITNGKVDVVKNWRLGFRVSKQQSDATTAVLMGMMDRSMGSTPGGSFPFSSITTPYVVFRADGTGNWFAQTHNGVTLNSTDTGVATDFNIFHDFEIRSDPAVPNIEFLIDGSVVATFTTDLPDDTFDQELSVFITVQTGENVPKRLFTDTLFVYQDR